MSRMVMACWIMVFVLGAAVAAHAGLCEKCRNKSFIQAVGTCQRCGKTTSSKAFRLCAACSARLRQCEHCLAPLGPDGKPSPRSQADAKKSEIRILGPESARPEAGKIDLKKSGQYAAGLWRYELEVIGVGTPKQLRVGRLYYAEHRAGPAEINDYHKTPWGPMYWVGDPKGPGDHGWLPLPASSPSRTGKLLPLPGTGPKSLELNEADNGKSLRVVTGTRVFIRLRGNPTTGYRWQIADKLAEVVESAGEPDYTPDPGKPAAVGVGGTFTFEFRAARPGKAAIKLAYRRPWEKGKPPAETFTLQLEVEPSAAPQPAQKTT